MEFSDTDSGSDISDVEGPQRRERLYRERINYDFFATDFRERFRFTQGGVENLLRILGPGPFANLLHRVCDTQTLDHRRFLTNNFDHEFLPFGHINLSRACLILPLVLQTQSRSPHSTNYLILKLLNYQGTNTVTGTYLYILTYVLQCT